MRACPTELELAISNAFLHAEVGPDDSIVLKEPHEALVTLTADEMRYTHNATATNGVTEVIWRKVK